MTDNNLTNPFVVPSLQTYKRATYDLAQYIHNHASIPWNIVTNADPTPAFLRPYAVTIDPLSGTYHGDSNSISEVSSILLYYTADPGLAEASPYCRLLLLATWRYGCQAFILDTRHQMPAYTTGNVGLWAAAGGYSDVSSLLSSSAALSPGFLMRGNSNSTDQMSFYFVVHDNFFALRCMNAFRANGGFMIWYPDEIRDDQTRRDDMPLIFGADYPISVGSGSNHMYWHHPSYSGAANGAPRLQKMYELTSPTLLRDRNNKTYLQKVGIVNNAVSPNFWDICPYLFSVHGSLITPVSTMNVNGNQYACLFDTTGIKSYLIPTFDLNP